MDGIVRGNMVWMRILAVCMGCDLESYSVVAVCFTMLAVWLWAESVTAVYFAMLFSLQCGLV